MKLLSPAKINLLLRITGKRPDGYHELLSVMSCIGLYDHISVTFGAGKTGVFCTHPDVPNNEDNIALKAARRFFEDLGRFEEVDIFIDKRIPVAAGLGGGSSNAATVLLGLNRHYHHPFSLHDLMKMGHALGADVPFFLYRKPAIARGIGEKLTPYHGLMPYHILLIYPGVSISTAQVYKNLNLALTNRENKNKYTSFKEEKFDISCHLINDLETVTASLCPEVPKAKRALLEWGAQGALMSGSGPTVFGLFSDAEKARNALYRLEKEPGWRLYLTQVMV